MSTPTTVSQLLVNFRKKTAKGKYKHFQNRPTIAVQIQDRVNSPSLINQGFSSLCGPASFLYCLAKKSPFVYAKYIVDLYDSGKAKLGSLDVEPGSDTKSYSLPLTSGMSEVDWIGLAGLRDSENDFYDYQKYTNEAAGITMPGDFLSWFTKAGYTNGVNDTNLVDDEDLFTLVQAHQKKQSGHAVCLFVGADVFLGKKGGKVIADHWVVLNSPILIDGKSVQPLLAKGKSINSDKSLLSKKLMFNVYSWGNNARPVNQNNNNLTVKHFLDYFYGYVSSK